jgi:hypothetical protein
MALTISRRLSRAFSASRIRAADALGGKYITFFLSECVALLCVAFLLMFRQLFRRDLLIAGAVTMNSSTSLFECQVGTHEIRCVRVLRHNILIFLADFSVTRGHGVGTGAIGGRPLPVRLEGAA